jgi:hypothetical protein
VAEYGEVVHGGGERDEHVPDGVRARDAPVRLEEEHAHQVQHAAQLQVVHRRELVLQTHTYTHESKIQKNRHLQAGYHIGIFSERVEAARGIITFSY